jgi:CRP-like cAMP-binding protein
MMTHSVNPQRPVRPAEAVLRRTARLADLSPAEIALIGALPERTDHHAANHELIREGEPMGRPRFLVSGWACRQRVLPDGRRQIFGFLLPGDGLGFCGPHAPPALCGMAAVTAVETVDAGVIRDAARDGDHPGLGHALAVAASLDEAHLLDHAVRLGRQTAYERMAHLLLELHQRLASVELATAWRFPLPLTQETLADALGLSIVHVNRTLQQMRRERLIEVRSGFATLLAPELLAACADFRPLALGAA